MSNQPTPPTTKETAPALGVADGAAFLARYATPNHPNGCPTLMAVDLLKIAKLARSLRDSPMSLLEHLTDFADAVLPNHKT